MKSDVKLLCPKCRAPLGRLGDMPASCGACAFTVRKIQGVPVLRHDVDDLKEIDFTGQPGALDKRNSDDESIPFFKEALASGKLVLEVGAGVDVSRNPNLVKTDAFVYSSELDGVIDAHAMPFADNTFDYAYAVAVFEHLHTPWVAADEIYRVLKPGGKLYVLTAFNQHLHGYPHHYFNMTVTGAERIFHKFKDLRTAPSPHSPFAEISYALLDLLHMFENLRDEPNKDWPWRKKREYKQIVRGFHDIIGIIPHFSGDLMACRKNYDLWKKIAPGIDVFGTKPL